MKWPIFIAALLTSTPALAWEFTETSVCTLTHEGSDATVVLTFDPATSVYAIALTRAGQPWADGPNFRIAFTGARSLTIGTDRQVLTDNNTRVAVSDSGFGNVLDGIQFNDTMTASLGDDSVTIPLDGAAEPMIAFRECPSLATS